MYKRSTAALCAVVMMGLSAGAASAGEVKGPPTGGTATTNYTAARFHANSACAFSGLNDYINGQMDKPTQTPADGPPGAAGHGAGPDFPIGCRGGSNPYNPPTP